MRSVVLALLIVAPAAAQSPYLEGKELQEAIAGCQHGCMVLEPADVEAVKRELEKIVRDREEAAFKAGRADARERCASLI
jgi:hypothetical protein